MRIALLFLVTCLTIPLTSLAKECSHEEAMDAEDIAARLTGWKEIYDAFEHYSHCDDGSIAEGFTDSIVRLLATHWETLPQAALIASQKPAFHAFVLRHINDTADASGLKRVARLANNQCPKGHDSLCSAIFLAATAK